MYHSNVIQADFIVIDGIRVETAQSFEKRGGVIEKLPRKKKRKSKAATKAASLA